MPPLNETNGRLYINFEDFVREKAEEADSGLFKPVQWLSIAP